MDGSRCNVGDNDVVSREAQQPHWLAIASCNSPCNWFPTVYVTHKSLAFFLVVIGRVPHALGGGGTALFPDHLAVAAQPPLPAPPSH
eukprot:470045-Lingulodinium_polyedra.AAC.1